MPTGPNRELTTITTQAHLHMKRIVTAHKKRGIPESNTHWLSDLILSQPIPNGNEATHWVKAQADGERPRRAKEKFTSPIAKIYCKVCEDWIPESELKTWTGDDMLHKLCPGCNSDLKEPVIQE